jgi:hypothetical protein
MNRRFFSIAVITALFAVTFASCDKDDNNMGVINVSGIITGEHANWTEVGVSFDFGETWAETAPISNGKFNIKLPIPPAQYLISLETVDFPDKFDISDSNVKLGSATFFVRKGDLTEMLTLKDASIIPLHGYTVASYVYVNKNVNISGTDDEYGEEFGMSIKAEIDLRYKKGWNTTVTTISGFFTENLIMTSKVDEVPSGFVWMVDENLFRM